MTGKVVLLCLGMVAGLGQFAWAQDGGSPDKYSPADLMAMEKKLEAKAAGSGLATETIKKYATDYSMLAFRSKSGQAEQHEKFADFYVVIAGKATLLSGGKMVNGKTTGPGELRGDSVEGGKETKLAKGDIVHVPANIPHQLVLATGDTFQYYIVKVQEVN
jgi:mannose-6-phosphate isomerase-like protein (cupin superfamily)